LSLGLIKKTRTVMGRSVLTWLEKVMNVLDISALLSGNNFQFNTDEILAVLDPVLDIWYRFSEEFFFGGWKILS